jgi:two-component system, OmpR family, response regulator
MNPKLQILLVEDDPNFGTIMKSYLELNDYSVVLKTDGKQGLASFKSNRFDLCILDVMMPEMDGFTLAREIRSLDAEIPLIFLTAKSLKEDVVEGFRIGADDYLTKPFDSEVMLYKIAAILKRNKSNAHSSDPEPDDFRIGRFDFNSKLRILKLGENERVLSPKEADLLKMLCIAREGYLPRRDALERIWGNDNYFSGRSMDVFITRLRKYLKEDPTVEILNIHGEGFRLSRPN